MASPQAVAHYAAQAQQASIPDLFHDAAREYALSWIDSFADELYAQVMGCGKVTSEWEARCPGRLLAADDAVVLHAGLVAGQRGDAETALHALRILGDRYLQRSAGHVAQLAGVWAAEDRVAA